MDNKSLESAFSILSTPLIADACVRLHFRYRGEASEVPHLFRYNHLVTYSFTCGLLTYPQIRAAQAIPSPRDA